jgi:hypothetical protein
LTVSFFTQSALQWELKMPIAETLLRYKSFPRPLALWPHLELFHLDFQDPEVMRAWSMSPFEAYGPDDLAHLVADEGERDVFAENYRHSIMPRMRAAADLLGSQRHLLDYPSKEKIMGGPFAASGTFTAEQSLHVVAYRCAQHVDAWEPIMRMWERGEFSIMFPAAPNFNSVLVIGLVAMSGAAGQLEEKLQGVSAGSDSAAWSSRIEQGIRQDDST